MPEVGHQQVSSSLHSQQQLLAQLRAAVGLAVLPHLRKQWMAVRMLLQPSCRCKAS